MIPYDLIIPSASRPHLLQQVLGTLIARVDQLPRHVWIHNDECFPGQREAVDAVVQGMLPDTLPYTVVHDNPPIKHGPTLKWLLDHAETEYVLYSQDDHRVVRPLPIRNALALLARHHLNQIRFNKRDTMDKKGREGQEFFKVESRYFLHTSLQSPDTVPRELWDEEPVTLCAADHWYFQTGVWRVAAIKPVVDWWSRPEAPGAFTEHCEVKINDVFNGKFRQHVQFPAPVPCCTPEEWNVPLVRATVHKTFIWGPVGEPAFVAHVGGDPKDWALERANRDPRPVSP